MSKSVEISSNFPKRDKEYIILSMLNNKDSCTWSDFKEEIKVESTLSNHLNRLKEKGFIHHLKHNHYQITAAGRERINDILVYGVKGKKKLKYPPDAIVRKRNYDHWILWMLNNNDYCLWSDFREEGTPVRINQSSLSKNLNSLMDKDFVINRLKEAVK